MTLPSRAELAADHNLGVGNVLTTLVDIDQGLDEPTLTFDTEVDGHPAWQAMTLRQLDRSVRARCAALLAAGIGRRDPVAVYVSDVADDVLSYLALTRIGAIPALLNGSLPQDLAAIYIDRLKAVGVLTDSAHREALNQTDLDLPMLPDVKELGQGDPEQAGPAFRHQADDIAVITHSSGTTGVPKAVAHSHHSLFTGVRYRLQLPKPRGFGRILSALPAPHAATIINVNMVLTGRTEGALLSQQRGPYVLDAIERWQPGIVMGFATTWSELASEDLGSRDLSSVQLWWNTGDCAHEAHIRRLVAVGTSHEVTRQGIIHKSGSRFVDGLGSTEMGHSQFFIIHTPESNRYGRCIGRPHSFSEIAVLDENGNDVGVGTVGELGIRAPSLAPGYWNDSVTTCRTRMHGFFLSGDLVVRDADGYYYYMDRRVDSVRLDDGRWIHTALSEERILARCPDVQECTVVAVREDDRVSTTVLCTLRAGVDPNADHDTAIRAALEDHVAATVTRIHTVEADRLPVTTTGKVRKVSLRESYRRGELFPESLGADHP